MDKRRKATQMARQRRRRKQRRKMICYAAVIMIAGLLCFYLLSTELSMQKKDDKNISDNINKSENIDISDNKNNRMDSFIEGDSNDTEKNAGIDIDLKKLKSKNAILIDCESELVLSEYNSQERIYPASLTKIMTAILVAENTSDWEQAMLMPEEFFTNLYIQNASMAGFQPGEKVTYRDLLYGILLPSGAECCMAAAEFIAGSEIEFVEKMNQKARELGMTNTNFRNTTGLHEENHYSTVEDISILLQYALKNENFYNAFNSSRYSTSSSNYHPDGFTFQSSMFKHLDSGNISGGEILGGKTGYTEQAGLCLASLANVNGKQYILVTAGAKGSSQTEPFHITDAVNVYSQIGQVSAKK